MANDNGTGNGADRDPSTAARDRARETLDAAKAASNAKIDKALDEEWDDKSRASVTLKRSKSGRLEVQVDAEDVDLEHVHDSEPPTQREPKPSLPATNLVQVATKAGDTGLKAVRRLPPAWQVGVFIGVGAVALAAWLGWLDPPERPHKGVAPPTATT